MIEEGSNAQRTEQPEEEQQKIVSLSVHCDRDPESSSYLQCQAGDMLRLSWEYDKDRDTEFDFARWDFVALHKEDCSHEEYESSRWLYGKSEGQAMLTAPLEPGRYKLTAIRDAKYVLAVMRASEKTQGTHLYEQYRHRVDERQQEDFHALGWTTFEILPGSPTVFHPEKVDERFVGKTGSDPKAWFDPPLSPSAAARQKSVKRVSMKGPPKAVLSHREMAAEAARMVEEQTRRQGKPKAKTVL